MRVLFVSMTTGQGHNAVCKALRGYLEPRGVECHTVDLLALLSPFLSKAFDKANSSVVQYSPSAYELYYTQQERSRRPKDEHSGLYALSTLVGDPLAREVKKFAPDFIVCSHVFAALALSHQSRIGRVNCKTMGIITDFTLHPYWEETHFDLYVTASPQLNYSLAQKGMPLDKVLPVGIPIQDKFLTSLTKAEARAQLSIEDRFTILIMSGSTGYGNISRVVRELDGLALDFQLLVVCGSNMMAFNRLKRMKHLTRPVHVYGFVDNIEVLMDASDLYVTKPGGISTSEAIAKCLPMVLVNPIPGQETRNAQYLINNGMATWYGKDIKPVEQISRLLAEPEHLECMRHSMKMLGKPEAVRIIGEHILKAIQQ